jgi:cell division septum initiation protein DivIVA
MRQRSWDQKVQVLNKYETAEGLPVETVKTSFPQLAEENQQLKSTIESLAASVSTIESSLRPIGLEVSAWHRITGGHNEDNDVFWSREIGYTRIE